VPATVVDDLRLAASRAINPVKAGEKAKPSTLPGRRQH
jgi:hypothetical protein